MTSTHIADPDAPTGWLKTIVDEEPVLGTAIAVFILANLGAILAHFHILDLNHWSVLSDGLVTPLAGVIAVPIGWLIRRVVTSPKTARFLQSQLDAALKAKHEDEAKAATTQAPIVVQVAGQTVQSVTVDPALQPDETGAYAPLA